MTTTAGEDPRDATVRTLRAAIGQDGLEAVLSGLLAEEVRWAGTGPGGACRNRAEVQRTIREQVVRGVRPRLRALRPAGDRVLLELGLSLDGGPDSPLWMVLTLDSSGRVVELQDYSKEAGADHDLALVAAGVTEARPAAPVSGLVAFAHVADIVRSLAFYRLLGFEPTATHEEEGKLVWAALDSDGAALMLAQADADLDTSAEAVFFYLYANDLRALRDHLVAHGVTVGEIVDGTPGPREEMRVTDPDGYCLMVAHIEPDTTVAANRSPD